MPVSGRLGARERGGYEPLQLPRSPTLPRSISAPFLLACGVTLLVAVAALLRVIPWLSNYPLHRDEALYGYWARLIASGQDLLLLGPWVDKPPLVLYLLAASVRVFGVSEQTLRLPGMIASLLTVLTTFGFARRAYGTRVALLAAGLVALSPFAILFAPTAFTDPWLTLWLIAAAWAALAGQPTLAGLLLGLAVASKQQGVLGVPLVLALLMTRWSASRGAEERRGRGAEESKETTALPHLRTSAPPFRRTSAPPLLRASAPPLLRATLGFALVFAATTCWDSLRWTNRPSFWDRSVATYGRLSLAPLSEWPQRAADWATQLGYLFGVPALSALMLLIAAAVGLRAILRLNTRRTALPHADRVDVILALCTGGYLALHFAITFQPWDRYLLPILPLVSVLAARGIMLALGWWLRPKGAGAADKTAPARGALGWLAVAGLVVALTCTSWLGSAGRLPVGSDHGAYAGLDQVIALLRSQPANAVIYHRWLSWHYDFYLFDAPQERRWWGSGWKLAADAARTARSEPGRPQWLVLPEWENPAIEELHLPLASNGLALEEVSRIYRPDGTRSFTLYRIASLRAGRSP